MNLSQWRIAAHLAWRTARRNTRRSVLVATMIGVPIALVVAASSIARTVSPNTQEQVAGLMGSADFLLASTGRGLTRELLQERLPEGSQFLFLHRTEVSRVKNGEILEVSLISPDLTMENPLLDGLLELEAGREPDKEGLIAVHPKLLEALETGIGEEVTFSGRSYRVSGVVREPQHFEQVIAVVGGNSPPDNAPRLRRFDKTPAGATPFEAATCHSKQS